MKCDTCQKEFAKLYNLKLIPMGSVCEKCWEYIMGEIEIVLDEDRCQKCNHLLSKHPRPKHLRGFGDWDYYDGSCCVRNCECRISCFGQQLDERGNIINDALAVIDGKEKKE